MEWIFIAIGIFGWFLMGWCAISYSHNATPSGEALSPIAPVLLRAHWVLLRVSLMLIFIGFALMVRP